MYVCICNALKEGDLKKACDKKCLADGESALRQAGCNAQCGQCLDYIENFVIPSGVSFSADSIPNL